MNETISAPSRKYVYVALGLIIAQAVILFIMGRPSLCECGSIKVWTAAVTSSENSQQLTDWYTFSHIIHGFIFYLFLKLLFPRLPIATRFLLAVGIEVSWELWENSTYIINKYREQALAQGYTGDSILNSVADTLAMVIGFLAAWRWPVWAIIVLAIAMEIFVGYSIRDNLLLNVLNFIHQSEFIRTWQSG
jgi:hypothetical protein